MAGQGIFDKDLVLNDWFSVDINEWFDKDLVTSGGLSNISFTSATTDGADVSSASIGLLVNATSATTDGADTSSGNVSILIELTSATTDGADISNGNISTSTSNSFTSSTTDGADISAGAIDLLVNTTSATTDGQDVSNGSINVVSSISFSSDVFDGADVSDALIDTGRAINQDGGGRGRWQMLVMDKQAWKTPKKIKKIVEEVAKLNLDQKDAEIALRIRLQDIEWDNNYLKMQTAMQQALNVGLVSTLKQLQDMQLEETYINEMNRLVEAQQREEEAIFMLMQMI